MAERNRVLVDIEPKELFRYFEELTWIPRESGNEDEVAQYLVDFAKENGLEAHRDEYNNVLIKKDASPGYEDHPTIVLQAHIDMVCEKNPGVEHDFSKDPIKITIEDGKVVAKETTLGADNGIGVAFAMATLADKTLKHPKIEFLATSDEERGMTGIENFDFSKITGSRIINIDSDDEGLLVVGCAGGPVIINELPIEFKDANKDLSYFELKTEGLRGGHSGEDIHRGRANANKLLARALMEIQEKLEVEISDITGGLKYNAIPRNASVLFGVKKDEVETLKEVVSHTESIYKDEYRVNDPDVSLVLTESEAPTKVLTAESSTRVLDFVHFVDTGIVRMDMDYPDFVETSISIGVIRIKEDHARIEVMTRSSKKSQYEYLEKKVNRLTELLGGKHFVLNCCPAWEVQPKSELIPIYEGVWEEMTGEKPRKIILHAGLEPSEFAKNITRELDMISLGPDIRLLHAPGEYVVIDSTKKVYDSFVKLLERL